MNKSIGILSVMMGLSQFLTDAAIFVNYSGTVIDSMGMPIPEGNQVRIGTLRTASMCRPRPKSVTGLGP